MADAPVVHIGENSPEQVAFKLMEIIANHEDKVLRGSTSGPTKKADRKWVLDTYAECLATVRNPGTHLKSSKE